MTEIFVEHITGETGGVVYFDAAQGGPFDDVMVGVFGEHFGELVEEFGYGSRG